MNRIAVDWRPLAAIGGLLLIMAGLIVVWTFQGWTMRGDFIRALREGRVQATHRDLLGKKWTEEELQAVSVMKLPSDTGTERAITRLVFTRGREVISSQLYA